MNSAGGEDVTFSFCYQKIRTLLVQAFFVVVEFTLRKSPWLVQFINFQALRNIRDLQSPENNW